MLYSESDGPTAMVGNTLMPARKSVFYDFDQAWQVGTATWTETKSASTNGISNAGIHGGGLLLDTTHGTPADNYFDSVYQAGNFVKCDVKGANYIFRARFKLSDATQTDFLIGMIPSADTGLTGDSDYVANGFFFEKNDGDAYLDFCLAAGASANTDYERQAALKTLTADTYVNVAVEIITDPTTAGSGFVKIWVDGVFIKGYTTTKIPTASALTFGIELQNGEAANKTATIDFIGVAYPSGY